jgi:AcrR family transcriptional regulator
MNTSADIGRRERKAQETSSRLTSVSRRLTAERGLGGFTVQEVCDEIDISRRTFFNYFPSKEDAILGVHPAEEFQQLSAGFLDRGARGWSTVVDDLVDMLIEHFEGVDVDPASHLEFHAALEREPQLLLRFMGVSRERDRQATALVAQREGVDATDPRAEAAVSVLTAILKSAGERYLDPANSLDFSTLLRNDLAAIRDVLAPPAIQAPAPRKAIL